MAAGAGRRYGMAKILVPGWLDHAATALRRGGCDRVHVVTGAARPPMPPGLHEIHCPTWQHGIGASLRCGLLNVGGTPDRILIHLIDYPDIGADVISRVIQRADGPMTRAVFGGRPGHPVVIARTEVTPLLAALTDARGAAAYFDRRPTVRVECGDLATGLDVDTAPASLRSTPSGEDQTPSGPVERQST